MAAGGWCQRPREDQAKGGASSALERRTQCVMSVAAESACVGGGAPCVASVGAGAP